jgi:hypothetical protein
VKVNTTPQLVSVAGFITLAEPVGGFLPGTLLGVSPGALEAIVIGGVAGAVSTQTPPPAPATVPAASIAGLAGHTFSASVQGSALASILQQIGMGPSASVSFSDNDQVQFSFEEVSSVSLAPEALGAWLESATPDANPAVTPFLSPQPGYALFIVTTVLQSQSISVGNPQPAAASVSASVGAAVSVSAGATNQCGATYQGSTPVTFAFQAVGLSYDTAWHFGGPPTDKYLSLLSMRGQGQSALGKIFGGISGLFHKSAQ